MIRFIVILAIAALMGMGLAHCARGLAESTAKMQSYAHGDNQ